MRSSKRFGAPPSGPENGYRKLYVFTPEQKKRLLKEYEIHNGFPEPEVIDGLAGMIPHVTRQQVSKWFQNERYKRKCTDDEIKVNEPARVTDKLAKISSNPTSKRSSRRISDKVVNYNEDDDIYDDELAGPNSDVVHNRSSKKIGAKVWNPLVDEEEVLMLDELAETHSNLTPKRSFERIGEKVEKVEKATKSSAPGRITLAQDTLLQAPTVVRRAAVAYYSYLKTETEEDKTRFAHPMDFDQLHMEDRLAWIKAYPGVLLDKNNDPCLTISEWPTPFKCLQPNCGEERSTSYGLQEHYKLIHEDCRHSIREELIVAHVKKGSPVIESCHPTTSQASVTPSSSKRQQEEDGFSTQSHILELKVPRLSEVVEYSHSTGQPANSIVVDIPKAPQEAAKKIRIKLRVSKPSDIQSPPASEKVIPNDSVQQVVVNKVDGKRKVAAKPTGAVKASVAVNLRIESALAPEVNGDLNALYNATLNETGYDVPELDTGATIEADRGWAKAPEAINAREVDAIEPKVVHPIETTKAAEAFAPRPKVAGQLIPNTKATKVGASKPDGASKAKATKATQEKMAESKGVRSSTGRKSTTRAQSTRSGDHGDVDHNDPPLNINWEKREELLKGSWHGHLMDQYPESYVRAEPPFTRAESLEDLLPSDRS